MNEQEIFQQIRHIRNTARHYRKRMVKKLEEVRHQLALQEFLLETQDTASDDTLPLTSQEVIRLINKLFKYNRELKEWNFLFEVSNEPYEYLAQFYHK